MAKRKSQTIETKQPITPARQDKFIEVLQATGSSRAAAKAASPHSKTGAYSTFLQFRNRDPEFALRWHEAEAHYLGALEEAIAKWSVTPGERPVVSNGEVAGSEIKPPDPRYLLASLRRFDPRWREKQELEVSGQIDHNVSGGITMAQISAQDVMLLPPAEREQFADLLQRIVELRDADPNLIEHDPNG